MTTQNARFRLIAAAFLFSTGGAVIKSCELTSWQVASFRSGIAALTLLAILPTARRLNRPRVWFVGLAYASTLTLYPLANKLTTAANATFLQSTAPLYLLLLAPILLKERPGQRDLFFMVFIALGMGLLFVGTESATAVATNPDLGNLLAGFAGISWALTILGLRWLEKSNPNERGLGAAAATAGNILACLVILPLALPVVETRATDWVLLAYLGILQIGVAYALLTSGIRRVPALEASLLLMVEPVFSPIFAWLLHGEVPGTWPLIGGCIILGVTVFKTILEGRSNPLKHVAS